MSAFPGVESVSPSPPPVARVALILSLEPPVQRRWTILLRLFLALPVFIAFIFIAIAAGVMTILAWFAALFTGRVPDEFQTWLSGFYRLLARTWAYYNLLNDVWPGVHLQFRPGDPVDLEIDHVRLRRSAVFFRLILGLPAQVVAGILISGVWPFTLVMWVVGLVRGRTPRTVHQTVALILRFYVRSAAYVGLLTPTQPFRGFFGDASVDSSSTAHSDAGAAPAAAAPASPWLAPPSAPVPAPDAAAPTSAWIVERPVKVLLIIAILFGCASQSASNRWNHNRWDGFHFHWGVTYSSDRSVVTTANNTVVTAVSAFDSAVPKCASLACVSAAAASAASSVSFSILTLQKDYVADGSANSQYATFSSILNSEESILTAMSSRGTTVARDNLLFAKLRVDLTAQYPAAIALVNSL